MSENATGDFTRNVGGIDGKLAATVDQNGTVTYRIVNLHGDAVATASASSTTVPDGGYAEADEFGILRTGVTQTRYGWAGGNFRSGDSLGGTILMGFRVHSPVLGGFLQADPVLGGSANAYDYVNQDPGAAPQEGATPARSEPPRGTALVAGYGGRAAGVPGAGPSWRLTRTAPGNWPPGRGRAARALGRCASLRRTPDRPTPGGAARAAKGGRILMRSVIRLGLAAVALAGSAAVATPASAVCAPVSASGGTNAAACVPGCTYLTVAGNGAAVCDYPNSVQVFQAGGTLAVCWMGHAPVQAWVAAPAAGIPAYDQVRVLVNAAGLGSMKCVAVIQ